MSVEAWAVIENGVINIPSISNSRRAAIVNWICVARRCLVLNIASDQDIEIMWQAEISAHGLKSGDIVVEQVVVERVRT